MVTAWCLVAFQDFFFFLAVVCSKHYYTKPGLGLNSGQTEAKRSRRKFAKPELDLRADLRSRLASSRKSQKVVNFMQIQLTWDQRVSTCVGWPNGEKIASNCVQI